MKASSTTSLLLILLTNLGCAQFNNQYNPAQHICGIADWTPYSDKVLFQVLDPDGAPISPVSFGHLTLTTATGPVPLAMTSQGCFSLPVGVQGLIEATVPSRSLGLSIDVDGSNSPGQVRHLILRAVKETVLKLQCPERRTVGNENQLLVPFFALGEASPAGTRYSFEVTHVDSERKTIIPAHRGSQNSSSITARSSFPTSPLPEGSYLVVGKAQDLLGRSVFSEACRLQLEKTTPEMVSDSLPIVVDTASSFEAGEARSAKTLVCFERETSHSRACKDPENFIEFKKYAKLPGPGRWRMFTFAENGAGKRSTITSRTIAGDSAQPNVSVRWTRAYLNDDPSILSSHDDLVVDFHAEDDITSKAILSKSFQCRIEAQSVRSTPIRTFPARCTSGECSGKILQNWTPCSAPLSFKLLSPQEALDINVTVSVQAQDELGRIGEGKVSTWALRSSLGDWTHLGFSRQTVAGFLSTPAQKELGEILVHIDDHSSGGRVCSIHEFHDDISRPLAREGMSQLQSIFFDSSHRLWLTDGKNIAVDPLRQNDPYRVTPTREDLWCGFTGFGEVSPGVILAIGGPHEGCSHGQFDHLSGSWVLRESHLPEFAGNEPSGKPWFLGPMRMEALDSLTPISIDTSTEKNVKPIMTGYHPRYTFMPRKDGKVALIGSDWGSLTTSHLKQPVRFSEMVLEGDTLVPQNSGVISIAKVNGFSKLSVFSHKPGEILVGDDEGDVFVVSKGKTRRAASSPFQQGGISSLGMDNRGRIWTAGAEGIARYEGCKWATFPPTILDSKTVLEAETARSLPSTVVWLAQETDGAPLSIGILHKNVPKTAVSLPSSPKQIGFMNESLFEDINGLVCARLQDGTFAQLQPDASTWKACKIHVGPSDVPECLHICASGEKESEFYYNFEYEVWKRKRDGAYVQVARGPSTSPGPHPPDERPNRIAGDGTLWRGRDPGLEIGQIGWGWRQPQYPLQEGDEPPCVETGTGVPLKMQGIPCKKGLFHRHLESGWTLRNGDSFLARVDNLARAANGELWGAGDGKVYHWNGSKWEIDSPENSNLPRGVNDLDVTPDGRVWVSSPEGLSTLTPHCKPLFDDDEP